MISEKKIKGLKTRYKKTGKGATVLLLHGWGCDLNIFEKVQSELENKFQVYSIDFPGFGESEPPTEIWGVEEYTQFIETFIKIESIENPILIGHSFGGRVSILYSSRNKTNKIVLVGSAGITKKISSIKKIFYKAISYFKGFMLSISPKTDNFLEYYRKKFGSEDYKNATPIMRKILKKVVNEDLRMYMSKINAPTLLIWGRNDTATPLTDAVIMEKLIPNSGLVILENSGHFSFLEKLNEFLIIINNFLTTQEVN